ncbi:MAG: glycosyltransferase family 4 protein [Deltaproteobacteria bacterium]|nr:glycosyltransferase family 4 protein [Deltaproteobacteria bacterium]
MQILIFIDRFVPEERANAQLYYELAKALIDRGHGVGVVTKMPTGYVARAGEGGKKIRPPWQEHLHGIRVVRVRGFSTLSRTLWVRAVDHLTAGVTFALAARKLPSPDLVLVYSPPLTLAVAARLYQRRTGVPYVLNLHDIYPQTLIDVGLLRNRFIIYLAEALEAMAYRNSAHIVVPAPGTREFIVERKGVQRQKVDFIPNWVDTERVLPGPKENGFRKTQGLANRFVVSYAGSMGFGQDLTTVLASARALQHRSDIVFLLVGDGVLRRQWEKMAAGLNNIRFLPMQPKEQFFEVLRASDICLVPLAGALNSPAIPGKTQHIMAVGRPVLAIVNPTGETAKLVHRSQCGLVARPDQPDEVVDIINQLYRDRDFGDRLGANGRGYAEKHFSLRNAADGYERIFGAIRGQIYEG